MVKAKMSHKQKKSVQNTHRLKIKKGVNVIKYSPMQELLDENLIKNAIWECLKNNDSDGVIKILDAYFEAVNKEYLCQKISLARSTLYYNLKEKNPTLKTLAKLVSAAYAKAN